MSEPAPPDRDAAEPADGGADGPDETDGREGTEPQAGDAGAREFTVGIGALDEDGGFAGSLLTFPEAEEVRHT